MGLLNLPEPLFDWVDAGLSDFLPPLARIVLWAVIGGVVSMTLYALIAPQGRIARGKKEIAETRRALDAHDGALTDAAPIIRRLLRLSLGQVRLTALPAILASLPLLSLLAWMSTAYGYAWPAPGERVTVRVLPPTLSAEWRPPAAPGDLPRIAVLEEAGRPVADFTLSAPVTVLHRRQWWNVLLGNPAGYLPDEGAVRELRMALPSREFLSFGPAWLRGWEAPFFVVLVVASLGLKIGARIQ